jgi:glutamate-1-semialdehyde 2,1-aminomutase
LIFDEVTAGWRLCTGGAHLTLGADPDIAVFAKGIANGFPMAAVIGRGSVMSAAQESFVSSTFWTERIGPVAALATIRKHRSIEAAKQLCAAGIRVQEGWRRAAERTGLAVSVGGMAPLAFFQIEHADSQALRTYFTVRMLQRGYLATNAFYAMCAHTADQIDAYLTAAEDVFQELQSAIAAGRTAQILESPVAHTGFARLA